MLGRFVLLVHMCVCLQVHIVDSKWGCIKRLDTQLRILYQPEWSVILGTVVKKNSFIAYCGKGWFYINQVSVWRLYVHSPSTVASFSPLLVGKKQGSVYFGNDVTNTHSLFTHRHIHNEWMSSFHSYNTYVCLGVCACFLMCVYVWNELLYECFWGLLCVCI